MDCYVIAINLDYSDNLLSFIYLSRPHVLEWSNCFLYL